MRERCNEHLKKYSVGKYELYTIGDLFNIMAMISKRPNNNQEANNFANEYRQKYGKSADISMFSACRISQTPEEMITMTNRFLQINCCQEFFVTKVANNLGYRDFDKYIMKVIMNNNDKGTPELKVLGPQEIVNQEPILYPFSGYLLIVDGPEKILSENEWINLTGYKATHQEKQRFSLKNLFSNHHDRRS